MPSDHGRRTQREHGDDPQGAAARPGEQAEVKAPTHAERCRTLGTGIRSGTLCTVARDPAGYPYGSLVTIALDAGGRPLMLLSRLAEHTQNLDHHREASLLLTEPLEGHTQPLAAGRVTLLGPCGLVPEEERAAARETFLAAHADAAYYVDFSDFGFYRLEPIALRYVGGFGRMSWVTASDYFVAEPDPLAASARGILEHMNDDHGEAMLAYATALAGITSATAATMTAVDRYGFELAATTPVGPEAARIAFEAPVTTTDELRKAMVVLVNVAREKLGAPRAAP